SLIVPEAAAHQQQLVLRRRETGRLRALGAPRQEPPQAGAEAEQRGVLGVAEISVRGTHIATRYAVDVVPAAPTEESSATVLLRPPPAAAIRPRRRRRPPGRRRRLRPGQRDRTADQPGAVRPRRLGAALLRRARGQPASRDRTGDRRPEIGRAHV